MKLIFKPFEVDNHQAISNEVYDFIVNQTDIIKPRQQLFFNDVNVFYMLKHTKLLTEFLQCNSLTPKQIAVVVVLPGAEPWLHVDQLDPYVRLLWPVKNCSGAKTKFYDIPRDSLALTYNTEGASSIYYTAIGNQPWAYLGEIELTQPFVFDASVAHEVHADPNATEPRISFTIGFDRDLAISKSVKAWFGFRS